MVSDLKAGVDMEDEIKGRKLKSVEELYADMQDVPKEFITTLSPTECICPCSKKGMIHLVGNGQIKSLCFDCPIWKN